MIFRAPIYRTWSNFFVAANNFSEFNGQSGDKISLDKQNNICDFSEAMTFLSHVIFDIYHTMGDVQYCQLHSTLWEKIDTNLLAQNSNPMR